MNLTKRDIIIIKRNEHRTTPANLSLGSFYIKQVSKDLALKELIGARIATTIFNLNCPKYQVVKFNIYHYILSEDLNTEGKFLTLEEMGFKKNKNSLYDVWIDLDTKYSNTFKETIDFIKVYIFDVMFHNLDRKADNIGILFLPDNSRKVTIIDNDLILSNDTKEEYGEENMEYLELYADMDNALNIYKDFKRFLLDSSSEFVELFKYYFELITPDYFCKLAKKTAQESNIDTEPPTSFIPDIITTLTRDYQAHYNRLRTILENLERGDSVAR